MRSTEEIETLPIHADIGPILGNMLGLYRLITRNHFWSKAWMESSVQFHPNQIHCMASILYGYMYQPHLVVHR